MLDTLKSLSKNYVHWQIHFNLYHVVHRVAMERKVFDHILSYLNDHTSPAECASRYPLRHVSRLLEHVLEQGLALERCTQENSPFIYYEPKQNYRPDSIDHPSVGFQLVDSLLLPARNSTEPVTITLSMQQVDTLFDCKSSVAFFSDSVGWGVKSGTVIPQDELLFAYFGEFISTSEAEKRHSINHQTKAMNYILTIREHIPASDSTHGGVLVSNIDASKFGSIARFVNHSCDPNACIIMLREQGAVVGVPVLKSLRTIAPGEQITFNYGGSEVDLQAAANNRGPTILGKRSAAPTEESSEKDCPKFDETQVRKPCLCGAARCCGYLPFK